MILLCWLHLSVCFELNYRKICIKYTIKKTFLGILMQKLHFAWWHLRNDKTLCIQCQCEQKKFYASLLDSVLCSKNVFATLRNDLHCISGIPLHLVQDSISPSLPKITLKLKFQTPVKIKKKIYVKIIKMWYTRLSK